MRKPFSVILLAILVLSFLSFVSNVHASNSFHGIITSDATWIQAESPYSLDGPTAVNQGVTLTIEPGVTVNLNNFYIQVNGTLIASGTDNNKIYFNGGSVIFTSVSSSSSIVQNTVVTGSLSTSVSVKVTKDTINELDINGGSSSISSNSLSAIIVNGGSPTIDGNDVTGDFTIWGGAPTITSNTIHSRPWERRGSPIFSQNKLFDGISADSAGGQITIINNELSSSNTYPIIYVQGISATITNNKIIGVNNNPIGISVGGVLSSATITQNQIYNCQTGISIDQCNVQASKNVIFDNNVGINIVFAAPIPNSSPPWSTNPVANIQQNTVTQNSIGIQYSPYVSTSIITNNNIQDNNQYNFKLVQFASGVTVANNWWGTTDTAQISLKIYDYAQDFNLGKVNFNPILTAPNPQAPTIPTDISTPTPTSAPTATASPTQSIGESTPVPTQKPTVSPSQPNTQTPFNLNTLEVAILAVLIVIAVLLVVLIVTVRKKR